MYNDISAKAQSTANSFRDSLQYLVDAQNQQKLLDEQASSQRYQNLLNQINQQRVPIQEQYAADSQSAYINKMLAGRQIGQNLNQLGLNTQGFGVSQMLQNEVAYGQNLNQLALNRNRALRDIDNQALNATGDYNADMLALSSTYAGRLAELQKYIGEQTQSHYNTVYGQLADAKAYEDQLAQIAWENEFKNRQLAEQKRQANLNRASSGSFGFSDNSSPATPSGINTQQFDGNTAVTINKSPYRISDTARTWLNKNILQPAIRNNNKMSINDLVDRISTGMQNRLISEAEAKQIWELYTRGVK